MSDPYGYDSPDLKNLGDDVRIDRGTGKFRNVGEYIFKVWYERTHIGTLEDDDDWLDRPNRVRFDIKRLGNFDASILRRQTHIRINAGILDKGLPRMERTGIPTFLVLIFGNDFSIYSTPLEVAEKNQKPFDGDEHTDRPTVHVATNIFAPMGTLIGDDIRKGVNLFLVTTDPRPATNEMRKYPGGWR
jgi:hypothetical protein